MQAVQEQSSALQAQRLAVKLFLDQNTVDFDAVVNLFHRWIQQHLVTEHQPIDVADYKHVVDGPGIVLVTHEANIHLDFTDGQAGLFYVRKQPLEGDFNQRLCKILAYTATFAQMLEAEESLSPRFRFRTDEAVVRFNDKLLAPQTLEEVGEPVAQAFAQATGSQIKVTRRDTPYNPFEVTVGLGNVSLSQLS